jgi:hypothetical protein
MAMPRFHANTYEPVSRTGGRKKNGKVEKVNVTNRYHDSEKKVIALCMIFLASHTECESKKKGGKKREKRFTSV